MEERSVKIKRLESSTASPDVQTFSQNVVIEKVTFRDITTSPSVSTVENKVHYAPCPALRANETVKNILLYTSFFG